MMYKLVNGVLQTPPTVWNGVVGYNKDLERLIADGWKPLITTGEGEQFEYIEKKDCIEKHYFVPPYDYRAEREKLYPPLGDVVDALIKAYQGDESELEEIITARQIIKNKIKKPEDDRNDAI